MKLLGAILAGGASRRFGTDKALALLDGHRLIDHAAAALAPRVRLIVICGHARAGLETLQDRPRPGLGPLGGLCAALHAGARQGFDAVLTIGCDTPLVPDAVWRTLLDHPGGAFVANLPIIGLWPTTLTRALDGLLALDGDRSVRGWARAQGLSPITAPAMPNINAAADLEAIGAHRE